MSEPIKIDVWSDIACPWCYLGKRRLEEAIAAFARSDAARPMLIEYHSFQLSPDMPEEYPGTHDEYLADHLGWTAEQVAASNRRMAALGTPLGIDYNMASMRMANTAKAHELLHYAKARGKQAEMKARLMKAYFSDGRHVGRPADLSELAGEVGLDPADVTRSLEAGEYHDAVEADIKTAARYGIRGVPFYVLDGKHGISGAQEPATFLEALETIARRKDAA
jgi:predicted DsbA family dithiol-disulfide isomerase